VKDVICVHDRYNKESFVYDSRMSFKCGVLSLIVTFFLTFFRALKTDMMTPLNRSVARIAKPGETLVLVSENCSLIVNGMYTATKKGGRGKKVTAAADAGDVVPIPLGERRTLMLPMQVNLWGVIKDIIVQLRVCVPLGNVGHDLYLSALHGLGVCPVQRQTAVL
jgi:hypothetical protein